jgi:predicted component of type VI protein secretion system
MTDPLSVAAGIAGLISLASELAKVCYGSYAKVKNASVAVQDVVDEIRMLRKALSDLEAIFNKRNGPLPALDHFMKDLSECEENIADFGLKIDKDFRNPQRLDKRLK